MENISILGLRKNRRKIGVYLIHCQTTKKNYVGSAAFSLKQRWSRHINDLNKNKHCNRFLQRSWNKYGQNAFLFIVLEECEVNGCIKLEQKYVDAIKPEFNMCKIVNSRLGVKHTKDACKKISKRLKGKKKSKEHIEKVAEALRGKKYPERYKNIEWRRKLGKPIFCVETGEIFYTTVEAEESFGLTKTSINKVLKGKHKTAGGYTWRYYNENRHLK